MQKTSQWLTSFRSNSNLNFSSKSLAHTLSITGGKGGVGKTSISLKLAIELSKQGKRVLLIDCDYNLSNTAIKLGLPLSNTFYELLSSQKEFDECLHKQNNFHLLSASNGSLDIFDANFRFEQIIIDIIDTHAEDYDYILLDCPAGISKESLILNAYCDDRIFVVTPDKSSITDSYSLMKILSKRFGVNENHLFVNQMLNVNQYNKIVKSLSETVENFFGARTHLLGGLMKLSVDHSKFDDFFLRDEKNALHRSFLKSLKKYTEQVDDGRDFSLSSEQSKNHRFEQDVHLPIC